jgi:hypothetical protein
VATICSGALKLGHFELVEARGGAPFGAVVPGNPPVLLLPPNCLRLSMPDQLFLCGRLLARVAMATEALDRGRREPLRVRGLELVLVALQRTQDPGFGAEVASQAILDDLARRLRVVLSAGELARAQKLAHDAWDERQTLAAWVHSTELGACRTGLLCCGGLDTLSPFWTEADGPVDDGLLDELIRFSLSAEYTALRRALGLELQG